MLALHFRPTEDLHGYTTRLRALATQYGLPLAFYGDRLNVFLISLRAERRTPNAGRRGHAVIASIR